MIVNAVEDAQFRQDVHANAVDPTLAEKVAFLSNPDAYELPGAIGRRETHMSWVFLRGERVYKLKKPVRLPYLDFSTLARREAACRAELHLNRRLAADVYENVLPLVRSDHGLSIGGPGAVVDWLVVMRRLNEGETLEHAILEHRVASWQLDRVAATLQQFYRRTSTDLISADAHLVGWQRGIAYNRRILLDRRLDLPFGLVRRVDRAQRRFLASRSGLLAHRIRTRRIVDGHGDLRPEHIWLGDPVRIIDCLEFNSRLRAVDPLDEIAFLCMECERLGGAWAGEYLKRRLMPHLPDGAPEPLFIFYRCYRATLRARLAIAHHLEGERRDYQKWPRLARTYLRLAAADALRLERMLRTRAGRPGRARHEDGGSLRRAAARLIQS